MRSDRNRSARGGVLLTDSGLARFVFRDEFCGRVWSRTTERSIRAREGEIEEALAYKAKVGNTMEWYSSSESSFGADVGAPTGAGFAMNVFLRVGETVCRTWHTDGRGTEQLSYTFALVDILPWGRQEEWQDSPDGWPQSPTYSKWLDSPDVARLYGPNGD